MLTGPKGPQHKVNNVTVVLKPSKPYFSWHIHQSVAANTTLSVTGSLYCMHQASHCHSNLVTTPSSCILLTLASVCNQNLTCSTPSPLSSFCRILFILHELKIELNKTPCIMLVRMGNIPVERTHIMVVRMGSFLPGRITMATIQRGTSSHITDGNVLNTHVQLMTTNTWAPLMDPVSQELTGVTSKRQCPSMDPAYGS